MEDESILDESLECFSGTGPEFRGGLSNHGPMAVGRRSASAGGLRTGSPSSQRSCAVPPSRRSQGSGSLGSSRG